MSLDIDQLVCDAKPLEPAETYVLTIPGRITEEQARRLRETWKVVRPNTKCIVLEEGITVTPLRGSK